MSHRRLDTSYAAIQMQLGAHDHARHAASRTTATADFLVRLGLPDAIGTVAKDRRKVVLEYFERAGRQMRRQCFVDLVSSFESDLFRMLGMASSKARHTLKTSYDSAYPFSASPEELARTTADFSNLGGYKRLLSETARSGVDLRRDLWTVILHRDYLAHGERWAPIATPPDLESAYRTLSRELDGLEPQLQG